MIGVRSEALVSREGFISVSAAASFSDAFFLHSASVDAARPGVSLRDRFYLLNLKSRRHLSRFLMMFTNKYDDNDRSKRDGNGVLLKRSSIISSRSRCC